MYLSGKTKPASRLKPAPEDTHVYSRRPFQPALGQHQRRGRDYRPDALPHTLRWCHLPELNDFCHAISSMQVRGAPLIGITAAYGLARALADDASDDNLQRARQTLAATRPTAD